MPLAAIAPATTPTIALGAPPITDTGIKGYLKWLQQQQPNIYKKVAATISKQIPQAFSDYHAGGWKNPNASGRALGMLKVRSALGMLGQSDSTSYTSYVSYSPSSSSSSDLFQPTDLSTIDASTLDLDVDTDDAATDLANTAAATQLNLGTPVAGTGVSTAANSTAATGSVAAAVGAIVQGAAQVYTTSEQASALQSINNLQLQRAQEGLAPLPISTTASGVPVLGSSSTLSSSGLLLIGGAALLLLMLSGKKSSGS